MKKYFFLFIIVPTACLFTSCQKETSAETGGGTPPPVIPPPVTPAADSLRLKAYTEEITGSASITFNLAYDASNRLASATSTAPVSQFLLTYPAANTYVLDIFDGSLLTIHEEFYLNSGAYIDSTFQYNDTEDSSTEKYIYNPASQVVTLKEYNYSKATGGVLDNTISYTYNSDGDIAMAAGTNTNVDTYEYYTNLSYVTPLIVGLPNAGNTKKMHLIKKYTFTSNGIVAGTANYTYTFDAKDRISTETQTYTDGRVAKKTYTYLLN